MKNMSVYKCEKCGNMVEVVHPGKGTLSCCGESMHLLDENSTDAAQEKHVPVFEGDEVKVGSVLHPMTDAHYIEWIEVTREDGSVCRRFLKPGEDPKMAIKNCGAHAKARAYCNLHGLWKGEK